MRTRELEQLLNSKSQTTLALTSLESGSGDGGATVGNEEWMRGGTEGKTDKKTGRRGDKGKPGNQRQRLFGRD